MLAAAIAVSGMVGCDSVGHAQQVRTTSVILDLDHVVKLFLEQHGRLPSESEFWASVPYAHMKSDSWGNQFLFQVISLDSRSSYVIASAGRDGKLDRAHLSDYVGGEYQEVTGHPNADLVLVDGGFVRGARK
jgi:hypothetical protein